MTELKWTYALDESKTRLVHINDAKKGEVYYCLNSECNERMSVKDGGDRRKHFYHINNGESCSYNNYLHTLAERRIVEWFNAADKITFNLKANIHCVNYNKCKWKNEKCTREEYRLFDLKKYYNCIQTEFREGGFVWDLWLTDKDNRYPPMAIEVLVTHKCEEPKLNSKYRIIEVKFENELQLGWFVSSNHLANSGNITFHNFNPKPQYGKCEGEITLNKFILYKDKRPAFKVVNCGNFLKQERNSIYELTFDYYKNKYERVFNAFYLGCAKASTKFPDFRHCSLCKYYKFNESHCEHICILYKHLKLEDKHAGSNAISCHRFSLNKEFIKDSVAYLSELSLHEYVKE